MTSPMDLATLLARVDDRQYPTVKAFLAAVALIPAAEKQYWGNDPEGVREAGPQSFQQSRTRKCPAPGMLWIPVVMLMRYLAMCR